MKKAIFALAAGWVLFGALTADPAQAGLVVPIPSTLLMMGMGLAALVAHRRKSK